MADTTQIGRNTAVSGRVAGTGPLAVEGRIEGSVELSEGLYIGAEGFVKGDVQAREVVIDGSFSGEIVATERVVLNSSARALAKITAPVVQMADGAQLQGELVVGEGLDSVATRSVSSGRTTSTASRSSYTASSSSSTSASATSSSSAGTASAASTMASAPVPGAKPGGTAAQAASSPATTTTTVTVVEEPQEEPEEVEELLAESASEEVVEIEEEEIDELRDDYTVKELRDELRRRDLPVSGTKDELIERLLLAQADEENA